MKRRSFIQKATSATLLSSVGAFPLSAFAKEDLIKLTILHTNDVHSRIEPFPMDGSRNQGLGGAARRASLIKKIRAEEEPILLLDAGDIFQGTPYFNFFLGELEMKLMTAMKYDAATIGNHDFDAGIEGLYKQLPFAQFPLLSCNYDCTDTLLAEKVLPYKIFKKGPIKIGVLGIGIELDGLVPAKQCKGIRYLDPIENANRYATLLKEEEKCDLVICLSHLGYRYRENKVSDVVLAKESKNIDIIIGGHTHTFMKKAVSHRNAIDQEVIINQVGWAGMLLGRLDIYFERNKKGKCTTCDNLLVQ